MHDLNNLFSRMDMTAGQPYTVKVHHSAAGGGGVKKDRYMHYDSKKVGFLLLSTGHKKFQSRIVFRDRIGRYYNYKKRKHRVPPYPVNSKFFLFTPKQLERGKLAKAKITREINNAVKKFIAEGTVKKKVIQKHKKKVQADRREARRRRRTDIKKREEKSVEKGRQAEGEMDELTALMGDRFFFGKSLRKSSRRIRKSIGKSLRKSSRRIRKSIGKSLRKSSRRIRKSSRRRRKSIGKRLRKS